LIPGFPQNLKAESSPLLSYRFTHESFFNDASKRVQTASYSATVGGTALRTILMQYLRWNVSRYPGWYRLYRATVLVAS